MNSFFASVEQQVQPVLRGKPVCVAPYTGNTGCCIAKSYEAKSFGISTGHLVGDAKKICPQIIVLESRPELYMFYHREIVKVLEGLSPYVSIRSVDEFNIKLTGSDQKEKEAIKIANGFKKAIREKVGDYLSCSIGISANSWLAKLAGEQKKPDGLVLLALDELPAFYDLLKLTDLPGINVAMERQLLNRNIKTPLEFFNQSMVDLSLWFGHPGRVWYYRLRGFETDDYKSPTKSIGHQHVLAPKFRNKIAARQVLSKMAQKCSRRLRNKNLYTGAIGVCVSFLNAPSYHKSVSTGLIADGQTIQKLSLKLYDDYSGTNSPFRLAVTLYNLIQIKDKQISLFSDIEKSLQLSIAMDKINDQFGDETIYPASMLGSSDAVPNRIPFGDPGRLEFFDRNQQRVM
ncbi:MAG: hypothetical protein NTZ65_02665 [Candidatus Berkelbacteria bacterium]|nr:hypothetical protein [Candidatus Berkelbacteria bacterium]